MRNIRITYNRNPKEGHSPLLKCFRLQLRGIVLRSQKRKRFGEGGQTIIEYATFIVVVVLALLAMQVYVKRGVQGKIKDMADQISPTLYNPNTTTSDYTTTTQRSSSMTYDRGASTSTVQESTTRSGTEHTEPEGI